MNEGMCQHVSAHPGRVCFNSQLASQSTPKVRKIIKKINVFSKPRRVAVWHDICTQINNVIFSRKDLMFVKGSVDK